MSSAPEDFAQRRAELERLHRRRPALGSGLGRGPSSSWVYRWLRGILAGPLPALPVGSLPRLPLPAAGECSLTFLGHATALIRYARGRVITDPCFARSLYGLRRARAPALAPGALEGIDVVLISHAHSDHLHRPSLERLDRAATVIVPPGVGAVDQLGFARVVELEPGSAFTVGGLEITAVPARHRVGWFGRGVALGYVVRGDGPTVYFSGDTGYSPHFREIGARHHPDVALLPISGYRPRTLRADHLSPLDALYAFEDLGAQLLLPVHHSSFHLGYEPLAEPLAWLRSLTSARSLSDQVAWLEPGESCVTRVASASLANREIAR